MEIKCWPVSTYDHIIAHEGNIAILAIEDLDTSVIVVHKRTDASSNFYAALEEGVLIGGNNYRLTEDELDCLRHHEVDCEEWYDKQP